MRRAAAMLDIRAQLLIAAILVSATGAWPAETADQPALGAVPAAAETVVPKADGASRADSARKPDARKQSADQTAPAVAPAMEVAVPKTDPGKKADARKSHTASNWRCGWGVFSWFHSCSSGSGRVGLVLGTAY